MDRKVYVLGSINMDLMITADRLPNGGETLHGQHYLPNLGGKGLNQARVIHQLGTTVKLIAGLGDDGLGQQALTQLRRTTMDLRGITTIKGSTTGLAFIIRTQAENRILLHAGANYALDTSALVSLEGAKAGDIFLAQMEVPIDLVRSGLQQAKKQGLTTVLNFAPACDRMDQLISYAEYVIVNQSELEALCGIYPHSYEDVVRVFHQLKGIQRLIVTLGAEGAIYCDHEQTFKVVSHRIRPIDTTGAGDAFTGALCYALSKDLEIREALDIATLAGAYACLHLGVEDTVASLAQMREKVLGS